MAIVPCFKMRQEKNYKFNENEKKDKRIIVPINMIETYNIVNGNDLNVVAASGLGNAQKIMEILLGLLKKYGSFDTRIDSIKRIWYFI